MKTLTILIGPSGSGKSTQCSKSNWTVFSTDHFFVNEKGEYHFNPVLLPQAHQQCRENVMRWCVSDSNGRAVVDNTNCSPWELAFYVELANTLNIEVELVVFMTPLKECCEKNVHGAPDHIIFKQHQSMLQMLRDLPPWYPCPRYIYR